MQAAKIILGIGGGIAAYKICELASRLTQQGHDVHVVMTQSATRFVAPLTFQALTLNPVHTTLWPQDSSTEAGVSGAMAHISLGEDADAVLIAPATADLIAKLAHGQADDLLTTLVLATRAPVLVSPAMNPAMYEHPAVQKNLQTLAELGYTVIDPEVGRMACEHVGAGRLPTTDVLIEHLVEAWRATPDQTLQGKTVVVTAGPTREALDPVRYITNRSSGKMGYAIAAQAVKRGARVVLISGPTQLTAPAGVQRVDVNTTQEMLEAAQLHVPDCDYLIAAAAPADYAPAQASDTKIKKSETGDTLHLDLSPTPDILKTLAAGKKQGQVFVGFAAETGDRIDEAQRKLATKSLDALVFNDVTRAGAGFDVDTNIVTWLTAEGSQEWPLLSKREVASKIWGELTTNS